MKSQTLYRTISEGPPPRFTGKRGVFIDSELPHDSVTTPQQSIAEDEPQNSSTFPLGSKAWWRQRKRKVKRWFNQNPLDLGIDEEAVAIIKYHLERGNSSTATNRKRIQCWKHICLEFDEIPASPVTKSVQNTDYLSSSSEKNNSDSENTGATVCPLLKVDFSKEETKEEPEPEVKIVKKSRPATSSIVRRTEIFEVPKLETRLSSLSLLERQSYCSMKKERKLNLQRRNLEQKELEHCTFSPVIYSSSKYSSINSRTFHQAVNIWKSEAEQKTTEQAKNKPKKRKFEKRDSGSRKQTLRREDSPLLSIGICQTDNELPSSPVQIVHSQKPTREKYKFCSNLSTCQKGVVQLQRAELFITNSFYRRRDSISHASAKFHRGTFDSKKSIPEHAMPGQLARGVSLLIGIKYSSRNEEVVNVIFDKTIFTEEEADKYIETHSKRLLGRAI